MELPASNQTHFGRPGLGLADCKAVRIELEVPAPRSEAIIVWRENRYRVRPEPLKPIRQLQPGDVVIVHGKRRVVAGIEPWR